MNVWVITTGEPLRLFEPSVRPWRSHLIAHEFARRGHTVHWWTSSFDHVKKRQYVNTSTEREVAGVHYHVLHGPAYSQNVSLGRLINHAYIAWRFMWEARRAAPPNLVICSYPTIELSCAAVLFGRRSAVDVILDIRDLWPDVFLTAVPRKLRALARLLLFPYFALGRFALAGASGLLAVSEGYLQWGLARAARARCDGDGIYPLGYVRQAVPEDERERALAQLVARGLRVDRRIIWFVGSFGHSYDLMTVLRAADIVERREPDTYQFVISGAGDQESELRAEALKIRNVLMTGWLDQAEICALGNVASVGIQPYKKDAAQGMPNKLFEYLSFDLPIVSSLKGENADVIRRADIGLDYEAENPESLAGCICSLFADAARIAAIRMRAKHTFESTFEASAIYDRLASHMEARCGAVHETKQQTGVT